MDPGYYPGEDGDEMENGFSLVNDYKDQESDTAIHTSISEPVKADKSTYAISEAFQVGLPGINSNQR
jgi:hypothetical protein